MADSELCSQVTEKTHSNYCHAASGKRLKLPLTVNPIPSHNAGISSGPLKARYDLWIALVKELP